MKKITSFFIVLLVGALFLAACSGKQADQDEDKPVTLQPLTGIVMMPVVIVQGALGPRSPGDTTRDSVAQFVDGVIYDELGTNEQVHIISDGQLDALLTDAAGDRLSQMQALGAKMGSNAVLDVTVTRFRERVGSDLSVNSPASAAFTMVLTHVENGKVLWDASFDETQEALTSNLLAFDKMKNRGFKWITVEEMVREGLKQRLAECPYLQK